MPSQYLLPNHPSLLSLDPLGICSLDEKSVSHFHLLKALFDKAPATTSIEPRELAELVQDVAYSLHGVSDLNVGGLREIQLGSTEQEKDVFRTTLFHSALQLTKFFPDGNLIQLSADHKSVAFSPAQMDCLLAHMFLGTLQIPRGTKWGRPGFSQYYDGGLTRIAGTTALPYLRTIIRHFTDGGYAATFDDQHTFTFFYAHAQAMPDPATHHGAAPELPVTLVDKPTDPSAKEDSFVLVAANAEPGPGAGGTHEERLVGQSPALAIACLLTPVLPENAAVVTSPLPVHAAWEGHGRESKMLEFFKPTTRPMRRYLIADALPLDLSHNQPDLVKHNVDREIRKLYAAFDGARTAWLMDQPSLEGSKIEMPPWGCGAFGGVLKTKMPCMVLAAGLAGLASENLELLVPRERESQLWQPERTSMTVSDLYRDTVGEDRSKQSTFDSVKNLLFRSK